jgi:hypothetical protein
MRVTKQLRHLVATALFSVGLTAMVGFLLLMPTSAKASLVTIDEIIFQQDGSVNPLVLAGTADFSLLLSGTTTTLKIVLTNTSTGATGGAAATNILVGIGFSLPSGVTIANNIESNVVALTNVTDINIGGTLTDARWGAGNGALNAINNLTLLGDVNASASTLQAQIDFDLNGLIGTGSPPKANVNGPDFGLLSNNVASSTCNAGLPCEQDSLTLTLALSGTLPGDLINQIDRGHVVLSFGSPTPAIPEPGSLVLFGAALAGLGWMRRRTQS